MRPESDFWDLLHDRARDVDWDAWDWEVDDAPAGWTASILEGQVCAAYFGEQPVHPVDEALRLAPDAGYPLEYGDEFSEGFVVAALRRDPPPLLPAFFLDVPETRVEAWLGVWLEVVNLYDLFADELGDYEYEHGIPYFGWDPESVRGEIDVLGFIQELDEARRYEDEEDRPGFAGADAAASGPHGAHEGGGAAGALITGDDVFVVWSDRLYRLAPEGLVEAARVPAGLRPLYAREGVGVFQLTPERYALYDLARGIWMDPDHVQLPVVHRAYRDLHVVTGTHREVLDLPHGQVEYAFDGRAFALRHRGVRRDHAMADGAPSGRCGVSHLPEAELLPGFGWHAGGRVEATLRGELLYGLRCIHRMAPGARRIDVGHGRVVVTGDECVEVLTLDARGRVAEHIHQLAPARIRFSHEVSCREHADPDGGYIGTLFEMLGDNERLES